MAAQEPVSIVLDRPRTLKYRVTDLRELSRRIGNLGVRQLLEKLSDMDLEVILQTLHVGLKHDEPKMRLDRAEELLQIAIDRDGSMKYIMQAIVDALAASGVIGEPKEGNAARLTESQPSGETSQY